MTPFRSLTQFLQVQSKKAFQHVWNMNSTFRSTSLFNEVVKPLAKTVFVWYIKMAVNFIHYAVSSRFGQVLLLFTTIYGLLRPFWCGWKLPHNA